MRIKFITDVELEVFKTVDAVESVTTESFKSGTEIDINVFNRRKVNDIDIRLVDGGVVYCMNTEWFEVL